MIPHFFRKSLFAQALWAANQSSELVPSKFPLFRNTHIPSDFKDTTLKHSRLNEALDIKKSWRDDASVINFKDKSLKHRNTVTHHFLAELESYDMQIILELVFSQEIKK